MVPLWFLCGSSVSDDIPVGSTMQTRYVLQATRRTPKSHQVPPRCSVLILKSLPGGPTCRKDPGKRDPCIKCHVQYRNGPPDRFSIEQRSRARSSRDTFRWFESVSMKWLLNRNRKTEQDTHFGEGMEDTQLGRCFELTVRFRWTDGPFGHDVQRV